MWWRVEKVIKKEKFVTRLIFFFCVTLTFYLKGGGKMCVTFHYGL